MPPSVSRGAERERLARLHQRLEPGQHRVPPLADALERRRLAVEVVVRERELARRADLLDEPGDAARAVAPRFLFRGAGERLHEAPRWVDLEDLSDDAQRTVRRSVLVARALLPRAPYALLEEILLGEGGIGDRLPKLLGRRTNVNLVDVLRTGLVHFVVSFQMLFQVGEGVREG